MRNSVRFMAVIVLILIALCIGLVVTEHQAHADHRLCVD